jgi:SAM-dependent methyltransferase
MAYYDSIAKKWNEITGRSGGAFKHLVLNQALLAAVGHVDGKTILELGAGSGYFMPVLLRHFGGQRPARITITDQSQALLDIAQRQFHVPEAEYLRLDVRSPFPFEDAGFDLVLAVMVFNELTDGGLCRALRECRRVLRDGGHLIGAVGHPRFVASLSKRGLLRRRGRGPLTMPTTGGLRLPIVERSVREYESLFQRCGFACQHTDLFASPEVLRAKPGLKKAGKTPISLLFECVRAPQTTEAT